MEEEIKENKIEGNTLLQQELKEEFKETWAEQQEQEEKAWFEIMGKNKKYIDTLERSYFYFNEKGFGHYAGVFETKEIVSNILMVPIKKINIDTGEEITSLIEVKGILTNGEELPSVTVPITKLEGTKWYINPEWGLKVRFAPSAKRDLQIDCIKFLSKEMEEETIYKFTGFTKINGKDIFLHGGGAIGDIKDVKVDLEDEVLSRYRFTDKEFDIKATLQITLACLETAPTHISIPLLALVFLAPLTSIIEEIGIPIGFLTWVLGPQQCKKTSLVSAFNSHFGNFDKNHAPLSFLDSSSNVSKKCAMLKDVIALYDDYFPSSNKQEAGQMKNSAEKLISLSADKMSGGRSKSNGEMRKNYRAKGQIVATGELFPDLSQSRMSRVFFININKDDVDGKKLKIIQEHQEELQYSMKKFIEYIIANMEDVKAEIPKIFNEKVEEGKEIISYRTAEMVAGLFVGYEMLMNFVVKSGVLTEKERQMKLVECWETLIEIGKKQNVMVENVSPMNMFLNAVEVLTNTRKLSVVDMDSVSYIRPEEIFKEGFVGFYDKNTNVNFLYPDLLYRAVKRFYNEQNIEFPFNQGTLCKELMSNGYLYKTEKQTRPQIRRLNPRTKKEETFIGLLQDKIYIVCRYNDFGIMREK